MATKKDYVAIAAILRREHEKIITGVQQERDHLLCLTILTNKIMGYFKNDNPNFDWDRFALASRALNSDDPQTHKPSGCFCTDCYRRVDEQTFEELDGLCEVCTKGVK